MLKTLHLANAYHPSSGGIGTFYRALMAAANRQQREMVLVVPGETDRVDNYGPYCRIYQIEAPRAPAFDSRYRLLLPHRYLPKTSRIRQILQQEQPDIVEICDKYALNYLGGLIRRNWIEGLRRPLVIGISHERMDDNLRAYLSRGALAERFTRWYMKTIYFRLFDEHIANSRYTAEELAPAGQNHNVPRGIHVLPMGVDLDRFRPELRCAARREECYRQLSLSCDEPTILYAGRLSPEKNVGLLASTMALVNQQFPAAKLLIAGAGPSRDALEAQLAANSPGSYLFLGHLPPERLADLVANVDVFMHPNPKEPFGIAPLEAMACGTPLVAPDRGGVVSYANPSNAWVVPPEPARFAAAISQILTDELARDLRRQRGIATAREHSWHRVADRFFKLYDDLYRTSIARKDSMPEDLLVAEPISRA